MIETRETIKLTREVLSGLASLCPGSKIEHEGIAYRVKKSDVSDLNPSKHLEEKQMVSILSSLV